MLTAHLLTWTQNEDNIIYIQNRKIISIFCEKIYMLNTSISSIFIYLLRY